MHGVDDHERDELFREMVGSVVVGAAGDTDRKAVGPVVGQHQQVRRGLAAAVGGGGVNRRLLGEEEVRPVQRQISVNLVRRDLVIAFDAVFPAGVHQHGGSDDVGLQEDRRVFDGAVHMALCRKVHHDVRMLFLKELVNGLAVADVRLAEAEIRPVHHRGQGGKIPRIGQLVHTDDPVLRMLFQHVEDEIASDKAGTAGHNDFLHIRSPL